MPDYFLVTGVGCAVFSGFFYAIYKSKNDIVRSLQSAVKVEFGKELTKVLQDAQDQTLPYAAIVGEAHPNKVSDVLTSNNVPDLQGVIKKVFVYELKSEWSETARAWFDVKHLLNSVIQSVPFRLCSPKGSALISEPLSANKLQLQNVFDKFEPIAHSTAQTIIQWAGGERTKGYQTVEEVLPVGTSLLGVGKLSLTKDGMVLSPPTNGKPYFLTTSSLETLLNDAQSNKGIWKALSIILACGSGILLCVALYKYYKKRKQELEHEQLLRSIQEELENPNAENIINEPCVICLDKPRDVVILECGHICICKQCGIQITECPMCRGNILRLVSTYRS